MQDCWGVWHVHLLELDCSNDEQMKGATYSRCFSVLAQCCWRSSAVGVQVLQALYSPTDDGRLLVR